MLEIISQSDESEAEENTEQEQLVIRCNGYRSFVGGLFT